MLKITSELKALYTKLTGKTSTSKTAAGVIKDLYGNITVTKDADTKVITIKIK